MWLCHIFAIGSSKCYVELKFCFDSIIIYKLLSAGDRNKQENKYKKARLCVFGVLILASLVL